MRLVLGVLLGIAVLGVIVLVATDVARTPAPMKGQCLLATRIVLPDVCVSTCSSTFGCTRSTRPYLIFFRQAASCMDAVIC